MHLMVAQSSFAREEEAVVAVLGRGSMDQLGMREVMARTSGSMEMSPDWLSMGFS